MIDQIDAGIPLPRGTISFLDTHGSPKIQNSQTRALVTLKKLFHDLPLPELRVTQITVPVSMAIIALINAGCGEMPKIVQNAQAVDTRTAAGMQTRVAEAAAAVATPLAQAVKTSEVRAATNSQANATMAASAQKTVQSAVDNYPINAARVNTLAVQGLTQMEKDIKDPNFWKMKGEQAEQKRKELVTGLFRLANNKSEDLETRKRALKNLIEAYKSDSTTPSVPSVVQKMVVCDTGVDIYLIDRGTHQPAGSTCKDLNIWVEQNQRVLTK